MTGPNDVSRREALVGAAALAAAVGAGAAEEDDAEMVAVPAGPFRMGTPRADAEAMARRKGWHVTWFEGEYPDRRVDVPAFLIDRYPVTNARYNAFCRATRRQPPPHWNGPAPPTELLQHPVVYVNLDDATAFARWAGKRLPSESEWEKAARGSEGRVYPWGDTFVRAACCWNRGVPGLPEGTMPVDAHPRGASPYGVQDLVGNAAEWTSSSPGTGSAIIRGGSWMCAEPLELRAACRGLSGFANNRLPFIGFRCAREVR